MHKQLLVEGWTLSPVGDLSLVPAPLRGIEIPATVPGCVHTALLAAGLIDDPYLSDNEIRLQWIGLTDWEYRCVFDADERLFDHERIDLACDGLDTVATIRLNDVEVARTENMHIGYRFALRGARDEHGALGESAAPLLLTPASLGVRAGRPHRENSPAADASLRPGRNVLSITFASAVKYARAMEARLGPRPYINCTEPFNFIRKMACNFGWDWGPVLTTCGVWKEVRIEGWSDARIVDVQPSSNVSLAAGIDVEVTVHLEYSPNSRADLLTVKLVRDGGEWFGRGTSEHSLSEKPARVCSVVSTKYPRIWNPIGHGGQHRYTIDVSVSQLTQRRRRPTILLEQRMVRIGLRTVELDTTPDEIGSRFSLKINGKPVFCKGFNWIPDDCFLDRACTRERYRVRLQQAVDAGANMLRVWGGGIYETDDFYDLCDEMGLMVWQDFPFACATYAEEEPLWSLVEQEARYNVRRLAHHPSLVLWNGCNENLMGYRDWGWREKVVGKTWGRGYYFGLLASICAEEDPSRPYWPASPYSGDPDSDNGIHPNAATHGNKHVWESWFGDDYLAYRRFSPRFCSEFGFQGPANYATMKRAIGDDADRIGSPGWMAHQKSHSGEANNDRHLAKTFETPTDQADRFFLLQLNQARALTLGVEWFRSRWPVCTGTLYWQLNDCWPVVSWSAIDGDGRLKPLYYATKKFYAPRLLTIQPAGEAYTPDDGLSLFVINDTDDDWPVAGEVQRFCFDGACRGVTQLIDTSVCARDVLKIELDADVIRPADAAAEVIVAQLGSFRAIWYFEADRRLRYPAPWFDATHNVAGTTQTLTVTARNFIRDLTLNIDRLDPAAVANNQLITLLPGESFVFTFESALRITHEQLTTRPVLTCANDYRSAEV